MLEKEKSYSDVFLNKKYKLIVLDMDGTLYYQRAMQFFMCMEMGMFAVRHPFSVWKLKVISVFRRVREMQAVSHNLLDLQYAVTADKTRRSAKEVEQVIEEWMYRRPLKYLEFTRDKKLCEWIKQWKTEGKKVIIYSDYPVEDKCAMLKITADGMYFSGDERIGEMKPSVKGLDIICRDFSVDKEDVLVIGDRNSKDGKMAQSAGVDCVILKKWKIFRNRNY